MTDRPFRDLCHEAEYRDSLSDEDFWWHVFSGGDDAPNIYDDEPDGYELDEPLAKAPPCPECGGYGACAYDQEGRPLIHAVGDQDEAPRP